jgi:hypothetical protein
MCAHRTIRRLGFASIVCFFLALVARAQTDLPNVDEPRATTADVVIHVNQVAYDSAAPKFAVVETAFELPGGGDFSLKNAKKIVFTGKLQGAQECSDWFPGRYFYRIDFSAFGGSGHFKLQVAARGQTYESFPFDIGKNVLATQTIPAIIGFYQHQRANSPEELSADSHLKLYGSTNTVDLRGGWCDASGDVSKYFSHLAYANYMSPQQTPLVVWSMANTVDTAAPMLEQLKTRESLEAEALYGADYIRRCLSPDDYFYITVFSYFNKDPAARRVVGLLANSKTTPDYQCSYREGGGMAIAALAPVSQWHRDGAFSSRQYLEGAERAFAHLQINNTKYDDDGKENINDDY